jgi:hypothetical protein
MRTEAIHQTSGKASSRSERSEQVAYLDLERPFSTILLSGARVGMTTLAFAIAAPASAQQYYGHKHYTHHYRHHYTEGRQIVVHPQEPVVVQSPSYGWGPVAGPAAAVGNVVGGTGYAVGGVFTGAGMIVEGILGGVFGGVSALFGGPGGYAYGAPFAAPFNAAGTVAAAPFQGVSTAFGAPAAPHPSY